MLGNAKSSRHPHANFEGRQNDCLAAYEKAEQFVRTVADEAGNVLTVAVRQSTQLMVEG